MIVSVDRIPCGEVELQALNVAADGLAEDNPALAVVLEALVPSAECEPDAYGIWVNKIAPEAVDDSIDACEALAKSCDAMAVSFDEELVKNDDADPPCMPCQARAAAQTARVAAAILRSRGIDSATWTVTEITRHDPVRKTIAMNGPRGLRAKLWTSSEGVIDSARIRFFHELHGFALAETACFLAHCYDLVGEVEAGNADAEVAVRASFPEDGHAYVALEGEDAIHTAVAYFGDNLIDALKAVR